MNRKSASELLESGVAQHLVRDYLGHANITTTSRYLSTTPMMLEQAVRQREQYQKNSHTVVTSADLTKQEPARAESSQVMKQ